MIVKKITSEKNKNYVEYIFSNKEEAELFWKTGVPQIGSLFDILEDGHLKKILAAYHLLYSSYEPKEYKISIKYE